MVSVDLAGLGSVPTSTKNVREIWLIWWHLPVIPSLRTLRQGDSEFEAILGYNIRL